MIDIEKDKIPIEYSCSKVIDHHSWSSRLTLSIGAYKDRAFQLLMVNTAELIREKLQHYTTNII